MKRQFFQVIFISVLVIISFAGCSGRKADNKQTSIPEAKPETKKPVNIGNETSLLLKDLKENGDYVNSKVYPSIIKASIVNESIGKNILVIDMRSSKDYTEGHIKGAVNKNFEDLPAYFETGIKPFSFDKIIMVSEDGQLSSYTTSLLRLMGYGNVYSMRWGMSAWNIRYAEQGWLKNVSGKFETKLETKANERRHQRIESSEPRRSERRSRRRKQESKANERRHQRMGLHSSSRCVSSAHWIITLASLSLLRVP